MFALKEGSEKIKTLQNKYTGRSIDCMFLYDGIIAPICDPNGHDPAFHSSRWGDTHFKSLSNKKGLGQTTTEFVFSSLLLYVH